MAEKSIVINYETLFELLNREKERPELQRLEPSFFIDLVEYLKEKNKYMGEVKSNPSMSFEERMKAERQLNNIHKIVKELYERREKKILLIALDKSRTKSNIIDTSALLEEEKAMFDSLTKMFDAFRANIIERIFSQNIPAPGINYSAQYKKEIIQEKNENELDFKSALDLNKSTKLVRFVHAVPKFVGTELEEYGPFQEEDVANLPKEIAELLMAKGRVEEIKRS